MEINSPVGSCQLLPFQVLLTRRMCLWGVSSQACETECRATALEMNEPSCFTHFWTSLVTVQLLVWRTNHSNSLPTTCLYETWKALCLGSQKRWAAPLCVEMQVASWEEKWNRKGINLFKWQMHREGDITEGVFIEPGETFGGFAWTPKVGSKGKGS